MEKLPAWPRARALAILNACQSGEAGLSLVELAERRVFGAGDALRGALAVFGAQHAL